MRQQAAVTWPEHDFQSGDQSPHSRGAFGAMHQKPSSIGRDARAPQQKIHHFSAALI
jgi:hypothetical protein